MEYNQFRQLLQLKGIREKETVSQLEDFIEEFPYCQTSRLLLAKALHEQDSIHYDRSLKLAAAYASSREVLRTLIEKRTEETEFEFPLFEKAVTTDTTKTSSVNALSPVKKEERFGEWYSEEEISGRAFIEQKEKEKLVDPHELIRQRLNEIIGGSDAPTTHKTETENTSAIQAEAGIKKEEATSIPVAAAEPVVEEEVKVPEPASAVREKETKQDSEPKIISVQETIDPSNAESKIVAEAGEAKDVLDKMELEHAMEESILDSLTRLPVIAPEKNFGEKISTTEVPLSAAKTENRDTPRSFTDWLKTVQPGSSGFEEIHAPALKPVVKQEETLPEEIAEEEADLSDDELIEKFLLEDPKIVPSKSEFYSPVNQAKKSVMDHDDVVSETLAGIYLRQGNTRKARWCYERLILLHPEKSAFFAALLKEIEDQPNNKEDL